MPSLADLLTYTVGKPADKQLLSKARGGNPPGERSQWGGTAASLPFNCVRHHTECKTGGRVKARPCWRLCWNALVPLEAVPWSKVLLWCRSCRTHETRALEHVPAAAEYKVVERKPIHTRLGG